MNEFFKVVSYEDRTVQKCSLCDEYESPCVTNGKPEKMSAGMVLHLMKKHNIKN